MAAAPAVRADVLRLEAFLPQCPDRTDAALLLFDSVEAFPLTKRGLAVLVAAGMLMKRWEWKPRGGKRIFSNLLA